MKKIKISIVLIVICFVIYFLINFLISFAKLSPKIDKVFTQLDNLAYNQKLNDSVLYLNNNKKDSIIEISLLRKDTIEIHFLNCQSGKSLLFNDNINEYILNRKTNYDKIIVLDTITCKENNLLNIEKCYFLYKILPFKFNKMVFPYSIILTDGKIIKTSLNAFKDE